MHRGGRRQLCACARRACASNAGCRRYRVVPRSHIQDGELRGSCHGEGRQRVKQLAGGHGGQGAGRGGGPAVAQQDRHAAAATALLAQGPHSDRQGPTWHLQWRRARARVCGQSGQAGQAPRGTSSFGGRGSPAWLRASPFSTSATLPAGSRPRTERIALRRQPAMLPHTTRALVGPQPPAWVTRVTVSPRAYEADPATRLGTGWADQGLSTHDDWLRPSGCVSQEPPTQPCSGGETGEMGGASAGGSGGEGRRGVPRVVG